MHLLPAAPGKLWALTCFAGGSDASPEAKSTADLFFPSQSSGRRLRCSWITEGHCAAGLWGFPSPCPLCLQQLPSHWCRTYWERVSRLKLSTVHPVHPSPTVMDAEAKSSDFATRALSSCSLCKKCYFGLNSLSKELFGDPVPKKGSWIREPQLCLKRANSDLASAVWAQIRDHTPEVLSTIYEAW